MNKFITIIIALLGSIDISMAQSAYYYYDGHKVYLHELNNGSFGYPAAYMEPGTKLYIDDNDVKLAPTDVIFVKLKDAKDYPLLESIANKYELRISSQNKFMPLWYTLRNSENSLRSSIDLANEIYETGMFAASEPDFFSGTTDISYDEKVSIQWGLYNSTYEGIDISISEAWNYATGAGVKIAVLDKGVDSTHEDLKDNFYEESYDTNTGTSPSVIYGEHGTECAGIISAIRNNWKGITGIAPDAKIMSISVKFSGGKETRPWGEAMADGINWAWQHGADILSCSWSSGKNTLVKDALDNAMTKGRYGKGCIIVKSAGNYNPNDDYSNPNINWPGDYGNIIAVSNIESNGNINKTSCYGDSLFIAAPGTDIWTTITDNKYISDMGTSMSAPFVSGVVALLLEVDPELSAEKIREYLARSAKKIGNIEYENKTNKPYGSWNKFYGYGLLNAEGAVKLALPHIRPIDKPIF